MSESALFSLSLGGDANAPKPSAPPNAGGNQPGGGSAADHLRAAAAAEVTGDLASRPKRKYTKRANGDDQRALQEKVDSAIIAQLDALHDPKAWGALLSLPADAALAFTKKEFWKLSEEERATLGASGSAAARTMMITNPRALAFTMAAAAIVGAYMPRLIKQAAEMRAQAESKKPDAPKTQ